MLNKIYLAVLAVFAAVMAFFTYYSWSWLQSIGSPQAAADGYNYFASLAWMFLLISSVALLAIADAVLAKNRAAWAIWTTFVYFAFFLIVQDFWLEKFASERFSPEVLGRLTWLGPFFAAIMCIGAAAVVFANQLVIVRLRDKLYPSAPNVAEESVEKTVEVSNQS